MRVLVVTTWLPTEVSPTTGVFVARDVAAIATRHDVRVLHLCAPSLLGEDDGVGGTAQGRGSEDAQGHGSEDEVGRGYAVERLAMDPRRPDHLLRAARRVRELSAGADVVHTMAVSALLPMTGWRPAAPWVHTEHWSGLLAPETLTRALRVARPGVLRLLRRPDVVAVVSEHLAAGVREVRRGPVVVVPNIVDAPSALVPRRDAAAALAVRGPLAVVGVGALIDRKDPLTAVATVAELRRRGADARLTWVGQGPLREETTASAALLDVPLTLVGTVPPQRVQDILGESDVFLLPTHAETFCVAAAEALAAGRPVVVGDSGGPRDFVAPPTGVLVAPGAPAADWADAVQDVWSSAAGLSAEEIAGPVVERYSAEAHASRVDEVYRGVRGGGDTGSPQEPVSRAEPTSRSVVRAQPDRARPDRSAPLVDVVIATHTTERQVDRAVRSVLDGTDDALDVRVTVVCHGLPAAEIAATLSDLTRADPRVRLIEHHDGVRSPAGPFTAGLEAATAPWVSIMGSDDRHAPGALRNWLQVAERTDAEVVLAQIELDGGLVATPPTRVRPGLHPRRTERLDLVRDRLAYRSAPLGLLSREAIERTGARLLPGAQTGEDIPFATRLYAGARVALASGTPYLVGTDATDRTTAVPRPVADELAGVTHLLHDPWFQALSPDRRSAVALKLLRIHVFGIVLNRPDPTWWTQTEREDLARLAAGLVAAAGGGAGATGGGARGTGGEAGAIGALSLADHDLLGAILDVDRPAEEMLDLARARRRFGTPRTLLPKDWRRMLHPEAPPRFMVSSLAARLLR